MNEDERARGFWDEHHHVAEDPDFWMAHPLGRAAINRRISGDPHVWPLDAFGASAGRRFGLGLSLGCGLGTLERAVRRMDLCANVEGIDGSQASLDEARAKAREAGLTGITYRRANLNSLPLPRKRYDAVFFHQSLHHVRCVEKLLGRVVRALRPDGVLFLDEWTGPSRTEWTPDALARARSLFAALPAAWRKTQVLQPPVQAYDPSECIRSSAILPGVRRLFDIAVERPYGGHLVSVLLPQLERDRIPAADLEGLMRDWLAEEDADLARDPSRSWYTALTARPRPAWRALPARLANAAVRLRLAATYRIPTAAPVPRRAAPDGGRGHISVHLCVSSSRSNRAAIPIPPETHKVAIPRRTRRRRIA